MMMDIFTLEKCPHTSNMRVSGVYRCVATQCLSNYVCCMHFWLESLIGNTTNSTDGRLLLDAHCSTAAAAD